MNLLTPAMKLKFCYMGIEQRREVASWLLSDQIDHLDYPDDLDRIQGILHEAGYEVTYKTIQLIWKDLSSVHNVEWLELPKYDATILNIFETQGDLDEYER